MSTTPIPTFSRHHSRRHWKPGPAQHTRAEQHDAVRYVWRVPLPLGYGFSKRVMIQRSDTDTPTLQHSHVSGSIPKEIGALVALTYLDLSVTRIEGTLKTKGETISQLNHYSKRWFSQDGDSCDSQ